MITRGRASEVRAVRWKCHFVAQAESALRAIILQCVMTNEKNLYKN
jgi:hypothetical protein